MQDTPNTRRRCRCETCDRLYHPTDDHPVSGSCPRCWSLYLRLDTIYRRDGYEAINARVRAIVEDPAGEAAALLIDQERVMAEMKRMTPEARCEFVAYMRDEVAKARRAKMLLVETLH